ncbi:uncharacterized protein F4812DRAFT_464960 [Daldinia caldariorum]|uniref:uncharacterized protein n=1 Tax=Daldinia caldariorum TaxID=326644 RepID=UPI0020077C17|nr:uncharacterized protein F4812DRAFT_464960 [Daldinia caldariorum]KAI1473019.1 hypothetical protein F4812DRAFT_464960 [Daldinia caldariorum]
MESGRYLALLDFIKQVSLLSLFFLVSQAGFVSGVMASKFFLGILQTVAPDFHFKHRPAIYALELIAVWWCWVLVRYVSLALFVNVAVLLAIDDGLVYESLEVCIFVVLMAAVGYFLSWIMKAAGIEAMLLSQCNDVAHRYRWDRARLRYAGRNWPQNPLLKQILSVADWVHQWNNGVVDRVMAHELQYPRRYNPDPESWPQQDLAFLDDSANRGREMYI